LQELLNVCLSIDTQKSNHEKKVYRNKLRKDKDLQKQLINLIHYAFSARVEPQMEHQLFNLKEVLSCHVDPFGQKFTSGIAIFSHHLRVLLTVSHNICLVELVHSTQLLELRCLYLDQTNIFGSIINKRERKSGKPT
jgi:hypothetical protein